MKNSRKLTLAANLLLAGLILLVTAGSCNGAGSFTISLSTNSIAIEQGGSDNITVTVTRNNFTNPINFTLEAPAGVSGITGTFTPNPVVSGTLIGNAATTLTLDIAPTVALGSYNLTVKATADSTSQSAALNLTVQAPVPTITITPASATVTAGDPPVNFTATLTGSSNPIAWSLTGPGSLSSNSGSSTSYTPPSSVPTTTTATLTANAGSLSDSATITINPPPTITISGSVLDAFGQPRAGLKVRIGSNSSTTDAGGNFTISGVTAPFDVIVIDSPNNAGIVFQGVTRTDPTLQIAPDPTPATTPKHATIQGNLTGGAGFPNATNHISTVVFGSSDAFAITALLPASGPSFGPFDVFWGGNAATSGTLHALQWKQNAKGLPVDYTGYGSKPLTLTDGANISSPLADIILSSGVTDSTFQGTINLPSGYSLRSLALYTDWGKNQTSPLLVDTNVTSPFSYVTPGLPQTFITTVVFAGPPGSPAEVGAYDTGSAPHATLVSLVLPRVPELMQPPPGSTGVDYSTTFRWQSYSGGIHVVTFDFATHKISVVTAGSTTTIPDLSADGLAIPKNNTSTWEVLGIAPFADIDAATGPAGYATDFLRAALVRLLPAFASPPEHDGDFGKAQGWVFFTAP